MVQTSYSIFNELQQSVVILFLTMLCIIIYRCNPYVYDPPCDLIRNLKPDWASFRCSHMCLRWFLYRMLYSYADFVNAGLRIIVEGHEMASSFGEMCVSTISVVNTPLHHQLINLFVSIRFSIVDGWQIAKQFYTAHKCYSTWYIGICISYIWYIWYIQSIYQSNTCGNTALEQSLQSIWGWQQFSPEMYNWNSVILEVFIL